MPVIQRTYSGDSPTGLTLTALTDLTGAVPAGVTLPAVFTFTGGAWVYSFAGTASTYAFSYRVVWADGTSTLLSGSVEGDGASGPPPASMYATYTDLTTRFGVTTVAQLSDTEGTGLASYPRVQQCFDFADAEVIRTFLDVGDYASPLVPLGNDVATVRMWVTGLAFCAEEYGLYFLRGTDVQGDSVGEKYKSVVDGIRNDMKSAASGGRRLNAARRWPVATAPTAGAW